MGEEKPKKDKKDKKEKKEKKDKVAATAVEEAPLPHVVEPVAKEKKDKKDKLDKKDKKDKKESKAALDAASVIEEAVAPKADKKDKKDKKEKEKEREKEKEKDKKKDKKEKKDKRPDAADALPDAKRQRHGAEDETEMSKFWEETLDAIEPGAQAASASLVAAQEAASQAQREAEAKARALAEEQAAAEAAAEAERALRLGEAAEAAAASLGPADQATADAQMEEERTLETDPNRSRSVMLSAVAIRHLQAEGERWLQRIRQLVPQATVTLYQFDNGSWEAQIDGSKEGAAYKAELCLRCLLASHAGEAVELRVLPQSDTELIEVMEIPEAAAGMVQPQKLAESWEVVAAFVREKDPIKPRPQTTSEQIELGKVLGLAVGQPVEVRFQDQWYHADVVEFLEDGDVAVQWLGGGEAVMAAVDVRASNRDPNMKVAKAAPKFGRLVLFGELRARTGAKLQAMAAVDRKVIGHFAEKFPPESLGDMFGFDVKVLALPSEDSGACARHRSKIAKASEALVEVLGKHAIVAGEADERRRAVALLTQMVPQASLNGDCDAVVDELQEYSQLLRVPQHAVNAMAGVDRAALSRVEDESGCLCFWLPEGTEVPPRVVGDDSSPSISVGATVQARYNNQWHNATVKAYSKLEGTMNISWEFDGSEQEVPDSDVKPVASDAEKKREVWLSQPKVLALIGPERARMAGALQVMALAESACPGLWTGNLVEAIAEVRNGQSEEDVLFDAEAVVFTGTPTELEWLRGPLGQQALRGVSGAAPCVVQLVGRVFFYGGYSDQRQRGQEYLKWSSQCRSGAKSTLSVVDADMREDVSISSMQESQAVWLRQDRLWAIEKETETMLVFDDGGGCALGPGLRRLLVCGQVEPQRQRAQTLAAAVGPPGSRGPPPSAAAAPAAAAAAPSSAPAATSVAPEPEPARDAAAASAQTTAQEKSDPKEVLKTMPWPATVNQWGLVQKKVWAGWPKLASGWIRIWSKSQDSAYFMRLKDMKSTFDINEVR